ncbi:MAG: hypothetical protein RL594_251 [Bacteroidota bacterium]|jgi:putative ATPase
MESLFPEETASSPQSDASRPLSERVRPTTLDEVTGQEHLLGEGAPLRRYVEHGELPSMILWGPPGTGKTTLATILAASVGADIERLSAVDSGVKELREALRRAEQARRRGRKTIVFIDEIHRFTKSQQDALLHAVERGDIVLVGATTENPSFEINAALLSRCHVYVLRSLSNEHIEQIIQRAIRDLRTNGIDVVLDDWPALQLISGGDARKALNALEAAVMLRPRTTTEPFHVTADVLSAAVQQRVLRYDKHGDNHYDTVSAFIKSMRGSDPDAAVMYLAIMIDAGEDPTFIARRMIIFASEDIGNADPNALTLAVNVFQAIERIGMPEGRIVLAQGVTYLATAPKSNASYNAINAAIAELHTGKTIVIPQHLRNAPTPLLRDQGNALGYQYPHDYPGHFVATTYLPDTHTGFQVYHPTDQGAEAEIRERHYQRWPERKPD